MRMINEELRIQSCGIDELDQETKELFVKQFKGDSITTLTFFYNSKNDTVILNHNNKDCDLYELMVSTYLEADEDTRKFIKQQSQEILQNGFKETFKILEYIVSKRKLLEIDQEAKRLRGILGNQRIDTYNNNVDMLEALRRVDPKNNVPGDYFYDYNAFMYGYIQGIRAERSRRRGTCCGC